MTKEDRGNKKMGSNECVGGGRRTGLPPSEVNI